MKCPKCEIIDLAMTDRSGVEIDYCTVCRGVWLDRGELDKIIERSGLMPSVPNHPSSQDRHAYRDRDDKYSYRKDRYDDDDDDDRYKKRKKGFLGDLFDF